MVAGNFTLPCFCQFNYFIRGLNNEMACLSLNIRYTSFQFK